MIISVMIAKIFSSKDSDVELHAVCGIFALLSYVIVAVVQMVLYKQFINISDFGYGIAAILGGVGAAATGQGAQRRFEYKRHENRHINDDDEPTYRSPPVQLEK